MTLTVAAQRAAITFVQAFLAVLIAAGPADIISQSALKSAAVAGLVALVTFLHRATEALLTASPEA